MNQFTAEGQILTEMLNNCGLEETYSQTRNKSTTDTPS